MRKCNHPVPTLDFSVLFRTIVVRSGTSRETGAPGLFSEGPFRGTETPSRPSSRSSRDTESDSARRVHSRRRKTRSFDRNWHEYWRVERSGSVRGHPLLLPRLLSSPLPTVLPSKIRSSTGPVPWVSKPFCGHVYKDTSTKIYTNCKCSHLKFILSNKRCYTQPEQLVNFRNSPFRLREVLLL